MERPISQAEYETLASFRYLIRHFLHFSEEAARAVGLTPQQHQALLAIAGFAKPQPVTIGRLAERLQIRHHSAVGLVDRLVAQGLVVRNTGPDRRAVYLSLTEHGTRVLEQLTVVHRQELRQIGPELRAMLERLAP